MSGNANSGRPSKPAALALIAGNRSKKNTADLLAEIKDPGYPVGLPEMPGDLNAIAQEEWNRIGPELVKLGLLSPLDREAFASYCRAVADVQKFRRLIDDQNAEFEYQYRGDVQTFKTGAQQVSIWRQLANDAEKRAAAAGQQFGLSPLARRNLKTAPRPQGELFPNEPKDSAERFFS